jgi:hypothetical protein
MTKRKRQRLVSSPTYQPSKTERILVEISKTQRVERGPARKRAVATKELLDDSSTAPHYRAGWRDAKGKPIALDQEMDYLDYYGEWVWHCYEWQKVMLDKDGNITKNRARMVLEREQWVEVGAEPTLADAKRRLQDGVSE